MIRLNLAMALILTAIACMPTSIPLAPEDQDLAAKRFATSDRSAQIFVFAGEAPPFPAPPLAVIGISLNSSYVGNFARNGYALLRVDPGRYTVAMRESGPVHLAIPLTVDIETGRNYFVEFVTHWESFEFRLVDDERAKEWLAKAQLGLGYPIDLTAARSTTSPPEATKEESNQAIRYGTGFLVSREGDALTNEHVVRSCAKVDSRRIGGAFAPAEVIASDRRNDLAIIRIQDQPPSIALFPATRRIRAGDRVVVYGFPLEGVLSSAGSVTSGDVSAISGLGGDSRYLQISAPVQPGNSGGPVADSSGMIVGVATSTLDALSLADQIGAIPQNVNFAMKSQLAVEFLELSGVRPTIGNKSDILSVADVAEMLSRLVVQIRCDPE